MDEGFLALAKIGRTASGSNYRAGKEVTLCGRSGDQRFVYRRPTADDPRSLTLETIHPSADQRAEFDDYYALKCTTPYGRSFSFKIGR